MIGRKVLAPLALGLSVFCFGASATVGSDPLPLQHRTAISSGLLGGGVVTMIVAWRSFRHAPGPDQGRDERS